MHRLEGRRGREGMALKREIKAICSCITPFSLCVQAGTYEGWLYTFKDVGKSN